MSTEDSDQEKALFTFEDAIAEALDAGLSPQQMADSVWYVYEMRSES